MTQVKGHHLWNTPVLKHVVATWHWWKTAVVRRGVRLTVTFPISLPSSRHTEGRGERRSRGRGHQRRGGVRPLRLPHHVRRSPPQLSEEIGQDGSATGQNHRGVMGQGVLGSVAESKVFFFFCYFLQKLPPRWSRSNRRVQEYEYESAGSERF